MSSWYTTAASNQPSDVDLNEIIKRALEMADTPADLGPISDIIKQRMEGTYNLPLKYYQMAGFQPHGRAQAMMNEAVIADENAILTEFARLKLEAMAKQQAALNTATQAAGAKERTFNTIVKPPGAQSAWDKFLGAFGEGAGGELSKLLFPKTWTNEKTGETYGQKGIVGSLWDYGKDLLGFGQPDSNAVFNVNEGQEELYDPWGGQTYQPFSYQDTYGDYGDLSNYMTDTYSSYGYQPDFNYTPTEMNLSSWL